MTSSTQPSSALHPVSQIEQCIARRFDLSLKESAINGIQIANQGFVKKIISAVDASMELLQKTLSPQTLYLVHHGVFWGQVMPIRGPLFSLAKMLFSLDSALYALHLPLDVHPLFGNNALLAQKIGLSQISFGGVYKNIPDIIAVGHLPTPQSRENFAGFLQKTIGKLSFLPHGPNLIQTVGVCSGGGLFSIYEAKKLGFDTLITGDASHVAYHASKELQINLFSCGHYATETEGIRNLGEYLSDTLSIDHEFFDLPTQL